MLFNVIIEKSCTWNNKTEEKKTVGSYPVKSITNGFQTKRYSLKSFSSTFPVYCLNFAVKNIYRFYSFESNMVAS